MTRVLIGRDSSKFVKWSLNYIFELNISPLSKIHFTFMGLQNLAVQSNSPIIIRVYYYTYQSILYILLFLLKNVCAFFSASYLFIWTWSLQYIFNYEKSWFITTGGFLILQNNTFHTLLKRIFVIKCVL